MNMTILIVFLILLVVISVVIGYILYKIIPSDDLSLAPKEILNEMTTKIPTEILNEMPTEVPKEVLKPVSGGGSTNTTLDNAMLTIISERHGGYKSNMAIKKKR